MTMREKMARALFTQNEAGDIAWDTCPEEIRDKHMASADAALSAMEEPTEAMVNAALGRYDSGDGNNGPTLYHDIFRAMIRRAKNEHVSNPE